MLNFAPTLAGKPPLAPNEIDRLLIGNTIHGIGAESGWFFAIHHKTGRRSRRHVLSDPEIGIGGQLAVPPYPDL